MQAARHEQILARLALEHRVTVKDLARDFHVTEDCIRKDLTQLEKKGELKRIHGGAVSVRQNFHILKAKDRSRQNMAEKAAIARQALHSIRPGEMVFLDISSTCLELARLLFEKRVPVTVVTNMTAIMDVFSADEAGQIIFIGGQPNQARDGFVGSLAIEQIRKYRFDWSFIGAVGVDAENGSVMTYSVEDGLTKRAVMDASLHSCLVVENAKFCQDGHYIFAQLDDFDQLITGKQIPEAEQAKAMVDVVLAETDAQ